MADFDLFDLISLPFDPPEKAVKKVSAAIDKVKKELSGTLGTSTQQLERDEINRKIAFLDSTSSAIFNKDSKLKPAYEELADAKTKQEIEKLTATVSLLKQSGSRVITNGTIRIHRQKTRLSKEHVEEVFHDAGFTISEIDPLKDLPKFPTNADKIYAELEALRKSKDPNPNGADLTLATDLYAFAAYLVGEPENAVEYRAKATPELAALLDGFAKKFATRNDNLGKLCASLATAAKSYVFNSEDNRQAYEAYLKYKTPALTQLFLSLGRVPKSNLLDPQFAEGCIKQISAVFGSYEVALAIYNKEAGLKDEPYIPEKAIFHVKCNHCQNLAEFADVKEAQKVNKCPHCGQALYKQCKKCQKDVLVSLDKCPECGFVFASAAMFAKYFASAEQAFRKSDFESARSFLFQAQSADPGEKRRTDELTALINAEEKRYEKPINDLRKLVADKMFQKASVELATIIGKFPALNVSEFETQINTALLQAKAKFDKAKKLSASKQADVCLEILEDCVDFKPTVEYLHDNPPKNCSGFSVSIDSDAGCANVSWSRSPEQGITYRIVRKKGKEVPSTEKDGNILADNTKETSYRDSSISPGQWYSYAVFAIRYGVFSTPVGETDILLANVTEVHAEQINKTIRLTWNTPKNCTGVTIQRTQNKTKTMLTDNAHGSFEDKDIQYGIPYSYKLCANYDNLPSSQGTDLVITPMPQINSFTITANQLKENTYRVSWNINQNGIDLKVLIDEKKVREVKSDAGGCDINLPANSFCNVTVLANSGGNWLRSENTFQINTYSPCTIDKTASRLYENPIIGLQESACNIELHLKVDGVIPKNVVGFYYSVRTGTAQNRWPTTQDIGRASDIQRIGIASYLDKGEILYTETAREESAYYVSLFTIYSLGGKEIISNPKPCRFDRPLTAEVFWKVSKIFLGDLKLSIEFNGNRPLARTPELALCTCANSQHLHSVNDAATKRLLTIPAIDLEPPQKAYKYTYDLKIKFTAEQLKGTKFFLFEIAPVQGENYTLRWAKDFKGKV